MAPHRGQYNKPGHGVPEATVVDRRGGLSRGQGEQPEQHCASSALYDQGISQRGTEAGLVLK